MPSEYKRGLSPYIRPYRKSIAGVLLIQTAGAFLQVVAISLLKPIVDSSAEGYDAVYILELGIILLAVTVLYGVVIASASSLSSRISASIAADMRRGVIKSSLKNQDLGNLKTPTYAMTCLTGDISVIQEHIFQTLRTYAPMPVLLALMSISTFLINFNVGLVLVLAILLISLFTLIFSSRLTRLYQARLESMDNLNSSLREKITGAKTIRAYGGADYEKEKFERVNGTFGRYNKLIVLKSYFIPLFSTAFVWLFLIFVYMSAALDYSGRVIPAYSLVLFMQFTTCIVNTMSLIPYLCLILPQVRVSAERIAETSAAGKDYSRAGADESGDYAVSAENVEFVDRFGRKTIENMDISIPKGTVSTVLGPNGSGITELVDLILAFSVPSSGTFRVFGMNTAECSPEQIRERVAYSGNHSNIFRGNLRFNLDPAGKNDDARIMEVCRSIGFSDYIENLPDKLDSDMSSRPLSGGQNQMLALARCLLR
ncbi:MAG: ABC transporter ATP-binding protein, partial [Candidatus Methanomethylophilaceae archaeon]|nr:ABC transporter ATP-binding protein [Candidatus Methanomethylophilaceae archaeon]